MSPQEAEVTAYEPSTSTVTLKYLNSQQNNTTHEGLHNYWYTCVYMLRSEILKMTTKKFLVGRNINSFPVCVCVPRLST